MSRVDQKRRFYLPYERNGSVSYISPQKYGQYLHFVYETAPSFSVPKPPSQKVKNNISAPVDIHKTEPKTKVDLKLEINTLDDLIQLAEDIPAKYDLEKHEYNIDLQKILSLKKEMIELNQMIGQSAIKEQIANLIVYFCLGLNRGEDDLLHTVIDGPPGSGKTEFAQKIAKIYLKLGILKKDTFRKVKRSDLIAGYLGQTALKTAEVIKSVRGGVLFIDEAYSLGNHQGKESRDSFSKECIDIINQSLTEMRDKPEEYFILMIAGYKDDLKNSFFAFNDGLERRFTIHFTMDEYSPVELVQIFKKKATEAKWLIEDDAITESTLDTHKEIFRFGGGDMEILLAKAKIAHSKNIIGGHNTTKHTLNKKDILDAISIFSSNPNVAERKPKDQENWQTLYN